MKYKAQFSLPFVTLLLILFILTFFFLFFFIKGLKKIEERSYEMKMEIERIARDLLSPKCLGLSTRVFYFIDKNKLEEFVKKYNNSQPDCAKSYKFFYRVFIDNYEFGNLLFDGRCIERVYVVSLNGKKKFMKIRLCDGEYERFVTFLQKICDLYEEGKIEKILVNFDKEVVIKGQEICIGNICNKINCEMSELKILGKREIIVKKEKGKLKII